MSVDQKEGRREKSIGPTPFHATRAPERKKRPAFNLLGPLLLLLCYLISLFVVYYGSRPKTYNLHVSDASPFDIEAPRSIVNINETERRANEAMAQVPNKMFQSEEITIQSLNKISKIQEAARQRRAQLYRLELETAATGGEAAPTEVRTTGYRPTVSELSSATTTFLSEVKQALDVDLSPEDANTVMEMSQDRFENFRLNLSETAFVIMQNPVDDASLPEEIRQQSLRLAESQAYFKADSALVQRILSLCLSANIRFNAEATENAKKDAYNRVKQNPIMINRGTRIISEGDIITEDSYALLKELDLIDAEGIDYLTLSGQAFLLLMIFVLLLFYLKICKPQLISTGRESLALALSLLLPLIVSAYVGRGSQLSPPVYFAAVVISSYFGFEMSAIFSSCLVLAVLPIVNYNPAFFIAALAGCLIAALFTQGISSQDNFAKLILAVAICNLLASLAYSLSQRNSWASLSAAVSASVISGVASVVAAIGIMPLFEMIFNTVSPIRLIELSQPGHPLMKRLFLEAPGTSQHCMMVANLADAAAEAIGANAMICRVGAYYHDIGKLENPLMFTENQHDYNPHDYLTPEESARIILRHPEDGVKLGRKSRLPQPVLRIIHEHHGSTIMQYFYFKAQELAEREGGAPPEDNNYRYHSPLPSSRESAIVMLADSSEAAMKSAGTEDLENAEAIMRNVFKIKNEQNQLIRSGLSYADVEQILRAFLQVYAGHFHERVKYPDDSSENLNRLQAEKN